MNSLKLLVCLFLLPVSAWSENFRPTSPITHDCFIRFEGDPPEGTERALISVKEVDSGETQRNLLKWSPSRAGLVLTARQPGLYKVTIIFSGSSRKNTLATFEITNHCDGNPFLLPSLLVESNDPEIQALARSITRDAASDYDKALAIHDWIIENVRYDDSTYLGGDAVRALQERRGVCREFSALFAALSRAVGVETRIVEGHGGRRSRDALSIDHAWNEIRLGGKWFPIDVTFDRNIYEMANKGGIDKIKKVLGVSEKEINELISMSDIFHAFFGDKSGLFAKFHAAGRPSSD